LRTPTHGAGAAEVLQHYDLSDKGPTNAEPDGEGDADHRDRHEEQQEADQEGRANQRTQAGDRGGIRSFDCDRLPDVVVADGQGERTGLHERGKNGEDEGQQANDCRDDDVPTRRVGGGGGC